jgi:hypothetical protein
MPIDPALTGKMITALPLDRMVAAPIMGAVRAQVQAAKAYMDFLMGTCIKKDTMETVQVAFVHEDIKTNPEGQIVSSEKRIIKVPLMSVIEHPNFIIKKATVDFEMEVNQSMEEHSSTAASGGFQAKMGWGPFSVSVHGKVSHKSEQTRKTDTRSKYTFHVEAEHAGPPEAMARIIEAITDVDPKQPKGDVPNDNPDVSSDVPHPDAPAPAPHGP